MNSTKKCVQSLLIQKLWPCPPFFFARGDLFGGRLPAKCVKQENWSELVIEETPDWGVADRRRCLTSNFQITIKRESAQTSIYTLYNYNQVPRLLGLSRNEHYKVTLKLNQITMKTESIGWSNESTNRGIKNSEVTWDRTSWQSN